MDVAFTVHSAVLYPVTYRAAPHGRRSSNLHSKEGTVQHSVSPLVTRLGSILHRMNRTPARVLRTGAIVVLALSAPVTLSAKGAIAMNECGATESDVGTCCAQQNAICNGGSQTDYWNYCYSASGICVGGLSPCVEKEAE